MSRKIIVIGSGAAGMSAASSARERNPDAEIEVFTEEEHIAYSPCAIPFVIEGRIKGFESIVMHTPQFYKDKRGIQVHTGVKVMGVDADKKTVLTGDGLTHAYDALVIAAGATVFMPPVGGTDLPGVFPVRTIKDGMAIQRALGGVMSVVIAGAGVIGLEMAVALRRIGREVTVIEMFDQVIPRIMDPDLAKLVEEHCASLGVKFVLGSPIGAIKGRGKVESVTAGGKEYPSQMVIMATGVRANLTLPNQMGLDIGPLGAVRVSPTMQPYRKGRLVKDVYLAGDLVMCESQVVPGPTMSQLGSSAVRQGEVAGVNAAGGYASYPGALGAWISTIGEIQAGGTGLSNGLAEYYGVHVVEGIAVGLTKARYYPGGKPITVKVLADEATHRMVGAQVVGAEEVTGRINWLSAAIVKKVTIEEFSADFENAYCPSTSTVKDVVSLAVDDAVKKL